MEKVFVVVVAAVVVVAVAVAVVAVVAVAVFVVGAYIVVVVVKEKVFQVDFDFLAQAAEVVVVFGSTVFVCILDVSHR